MLFVSCCLVFMLLFADGVCVLCVVVVCCYCLLLSVQCRCGLWLLVVGCWLLFVGVAGVCCGCCSLVLFVVLVLFADVCCLLLRSAVCR